MFYIAQLFITTSLYSMGCTGAGLVLYRLLVGSRLGDDEPGGIIVLASAFFLGQGVLAGLWQFTAMLGWFNQVVVTLISVVCLLTAFVLSKPYWHDIRRVLGDELNYILAAPVYLKLMIALTLILYFGGLTRIGHYLLSDATAYYLTWPKIISASHLLEPLQGLLNEFSMRMPLMGEMHFAALMLYGLADDVRILDWFFMGAGAILLMAICRRTGIGRVGRYIALAMMFSSTAVLLLLCSGKVDLMAAALGLAAVYWAMHGDFTAPGIELRMAGLLTGFAIVGKLSYAISFLPVVVGLVIWRVLAANLGSANESPGVFHLIRPVLGALVRLGGWTFAAMVPYFFKLFLWQEALFTQPWALFNKLDKTRFPGPVTRRLVLTYPFALVFGKYLGQYGNISPLMLAFAPLSLLMPKPKSWRQFLFSPLTMLTLSACLGITCWIIIRTSGFQMRYIMATLLLLIPLAAKGAEYVLQTKNCKIFKVGIVFTCLITLLSISSIMFSSVYKAGNTYKILTGQMPKSDRDGQYLQAIHTLHLIAPKGARIIFLGFHTYWLRPDLLQCQSRLSDFRVWNNRNVSYQKRWVEIYKRGFEYVFIVKHLKNNFEDMIKNRPDWVKLKTIYDQSLILIYRLKYDNVPFKVKTCCRQVRPPAWQLVGE
jgi:hypothetical protein